MITYLSSSSPKTKVTTRAFKWLFMREDANLLFWWFKVGNAGLIGPYLFFQVMEKVKVNQERLKVAQSRQESYIDIRRRELEFEVDD